MTAPPVPKGPGGAVSPFSKLPAPCSVSHNSVVSTRIASGSLRERRLNFRERGLFPLLDKSTTRACGAEMLRWLNPLWMTRAPRMAHRCRLTIGRPPAAAARSPRARYHSDRWVLRSAGVWQSSAEFAATLVALEPFRAPETATLSAEVTRAARAGWLVLTFAFAGWCAYSLLRLTARLLRDRLDQECSRSQQLETDLNRVSGLLERIAIGLERRGEAGGFESAANLARARAAAEVEAAVRAGQWALAESLLVEFETAYPDDPKASALRASLEATRRSSLEERLAELAAARDVNDPVRVLELYRSVAPDLDRDVHGQLRSGVAQWFLSLIYRRLRTGKIQIEVVELASQFADTFAATTEGASVQAALPTLRRARDCALAVLNRTPEWNRHAPSACARPGRCPRRQHRRTTRFPDIKGGNSPNLQKDGTIKCEEPKLPGLSCLPQLDARRAVG